MAAKHLAVFMRSRPYVSLDCLQQCMKHDMSVKGMHPAKTSKHGHTNFDLLHLVKNIHAVDDYTNNRILACSRNVQVGSHVRLPDEEI